MIYRSLRAPEMHHICVCVCTYKRLWLLRTLLQTLENQETGGKFSYSVSIVDNDRSGSARQVVEAHSLQSKVDICYAIEPEQNIARARNLAIANSRGDFVALIDDDELPGSNWLLGMYKALALFDVSGVLGPVRTRYVVPPPRWVKRGRFFERPSYFSGYFLNWWLTRTGNCLLKRELFEGDGNWFLPKFGSGGEDRDFFKRMIQKGHVFVWCDETPVFEAVPPERWDMTIMLKRALLRGKMTYLSRKHDLKDILSSPVLLFTYSLALPLLLAFSPVFGYETFVKHLVKSADHLGKLLALFRIEPIKERYIV
jgi:succinoglycan biosynthesis protein ExoM